MLNKHRKAQADRLPDNLQRKEWTNYDDYLRDQKRIHEKVFSRPALFCNLCGYPMDYQGHKMTEWEEKWSTHEVCKKKMNNFLDRESGILRDRKGSSPGRPSK
ncbi:hypothetical protein ACK8P5_26580 (plasmid) [Paenibacillus sp. EC2-1]|uniref:hypothetical protein n=1 Tax=Paenibacillus sp. EC2-1 TaxID=3388665 RepID=UPI003BEF2658